MSWSVNHDGAFPGEDEVSAAGGVGSDLADWPDDPYNGSPMDDEGPDPGNFDYEVSPDGSAYTLVAYLSSGPLPVD